jgi:hypothetical protein
MMIYFPFLEMILEMIRSGLILWGIVLFRTKYNRNNYNKCVDDLIRHGKLKGDDDGSYFKKCPTVRDKIDYVCSHVIVLFLSAIVWFAVILHWKGYF